MNNKIAFLGLIEILSALSIGLIILSLTYTVLKKYGKTKLDIGHNNQAYSIFIASVLFSVGYMVSGVIQPILSSFRLLSNSVTNTTQLITKFLGFGAIYIAIAYIAGLIISLSCINIYSALTPIDEFKEIKNNNVGVALISAAIMITLIMMSRDGVVMIIESMIPYPTMPPK